MALFYAFLNNIAMMLAVAVIHGFTSKWLRNRKLASKITAGIIFSLAVFVTMHNNFVLTKGLVFDARSIVISVCGLFAGPLAVLITSTTAIIQRIVHGGIGTLTGLCVIISSAIIGLMFRQLRKSKMKSATVINFYLFGVIVHINMLIMMLTLPDKLLIDTYKTVTLPVLLILPIGTVCFCKLMSSQEEQIKLAKSLREKDELLGEMGAIAQIGAWEFDIKTRLNTWTNEVFRIHDATPSKAITAETLIRNYPKESRNMLEMAIKEAVELNKALNLELEITTAKGTNKWVKILGSPVLDNHEITKVRGSIQDITERKTMQEELKKWSEELEIKVNKRTKELTDSHTATLNILQDLQKAKDLLEESKAGFHNIVEKSTDGIVVLNGGGIIKYANPTVEKFLCRRTKDLVGEQISFSVTENKVMELDITRHNNQAGVAEMTATPTNWEGQKAWLVLIRDITDRKNAEIELQKSEAMLKSVAAGVPIGLGIAVNRVTSWVNDYLLQLLGRSKEEIIGKSTRIFYENEDGYDLVGSQYYRDLREKGRAEIEVNWMRKNGTIINILLTGSPLDKKNISQGIVFAVMDITKRKQAEKTLRESEENFRIIFDHNIDGILIANPKDKTFFSGNKTICNMLGYSEEEIRELGLADIHPTEYLPCAEKQFDKLLRKEITCAENTLMKRKDGSVFYADISASSIRLFGKTYLMGSIRDITERRKTEEKLAKSEAMLKSVAIAAPIGIGVVADRKIVWANDKFLQILGRTQDEIINKSTRILYVDDEGYNYIGHEYYKELNEQGKAEVEIKWLHKDGRVIDIFLTGVPLDPKDMSQGVVFGVMDITERKRVEEEIRKALEAKSEFVSIVSHELRTPLTAIKEGIALVVDEVVGEINGEQKELLDISKKNVDRLARLINNVLDFQKLDSGMMKFNVEMCDINDVTKEVYDIMAISAKNAGLNLTLQLDTGLPKCSFDKDKIVQVLTNLTTNAIKFTAKGDITIKTAKAPDAVEVSVSDTGCGIRRSEMANVFGKFEQLEHGGSRKTGGTGLGLAISKEIIEWHKGEICVESIYGKGSKFTFTLPVQESNKNTGNKHTKETKIKAEQYNS